jgi:hypothetical protein
MDGVSAKKIVVRYISQDVHFPVIYNKLVSILQASFLFEVSC